MKRLCRLFWISTVIATLLFFSPGSSPAQTKLKVKDLALPYQEWLKFTAYIISDKELDVFLHLQNDRDRDLFIQAFWNARDPTPATPQNEFKDEHAKRFKEANYRFKFGSSREGWMTDRGRYYIILGPPISRTSIAGSLETYPAEIWSYYGDTDKGMPSHFQLCFYQYKNAGEYKFYSPVADGPARLLVNSQTEFAMTDYEGMYEKLINIQPDLASVALSIVPGEIPYMYQPSLQTPMFLAAILESPRKGLSDTYATHFLKYKGVVSTEYLTNYMKSEAATVLLFHPESGMAFCDFAVAPERLSLDYYEPKDEYSCNFQVDVNLRAGDTVLLQYSKEYPLTIAGNKMKEIEGMGVCIADSFPVIEGKSKLIVLVRNTIGKEFSILERDIEVPPASGTPGLLAPIFGSRLVEAQPGMHFPFQAGDLKLQAEPKGAFATSDQISYVFSAFGLTRELWKDGSIGIEVKSASPAGAIQKSFNIPLSGRPFSRWAVFAQALDTAEFPPDYYEMTMTLRDGRGERLDDKKGHFIISPAKALSHPTIASKAFPLGNRFLFHYMLAYQYSQTGQVQRADEAYRTALELNPSYKNKVPEYGAFLVKTSRFAEALELAEGIRDDANLKFQYHQLKGLALAGLERYGDAILSLQEGNRIYNSDAGLLAVLGKCYHKTGEKQQALTALKASLSLNPEQPDVKAMIQEIEGKK